MLIEVCEFYRDSLLAFNLSEATGQAKMSRVTDVNS